MGKAMIIPEEKASAAFRSSLCELQAKGRFKNLIARRVKDKDGTYKMYVINNNAYRDKVNSVDGNGRPLVG
jgi:diadenosine tetraphosphate (Ap4A) HIT family hydrolase